MFVVVVAVVVIVNEGIVVGVCLFVCCFGTGDLKPTVSRAFFPIVETPFGLYAIGGGWLLNSLA